MHGAAISLGNVYEPYLPFTTDLGIFANALIAGHNLVESYYAAQPVLSWMSVCIGDPLDRPYAAFQNHEVQSESIWSDYRRIVLSHAGDVRAAAKDLKARAEEKKESLYLEALGAAQMDAGDLQNAEMSFQEAMVYTSDPVIEFRLLLERARSLEKQGRGSNACGLLKENLSRFNAPDQHSLILSWIKRMESPPSSSDLAPSHP
jgi:tetratricopeptide (TPR) repeat protein